MADAIQELKLVLSLDTKAYQAGLKGAKMSLMGLSSAQVAFGMAAATYAMRGINALVKTYKDYDKELDRLTYFVTDYNKASRSMLQANVQTTASLRTVGEAAAIYSSRLSLSASDLTQLSALTAQYADDTGDSAGAVADSITDLSNRWDKDAGGIGSALMKAGQMTGLAMSTIGAQMLDATPLAKGLGMEFEEMLAYAIEFKKAGVDFGHYISLMQKNFSKFGGNVAESNREIKGLTNTVRSFATQQEAVAFLMEEGFSDRAALELADALRNITQPELDKTEEAVRGVSDSIDELNALIEANLGFWDKLEIGAKKAWQDFLGNQTTAWDNFVNALTFKGFSLEGLFTETFKSLKFPSLDKQMEEVLKYIGYADDEIKKVMQNKDLFTKLQQNDVTKDLVAPGKIMKFDFPKYEKLNFNPVPEKKSEWTMPEAPAIEKMALTSPVMTDMSPTGWTLKAPKPMPYVDNAYGEGGDQKQTVQGFGQMAMGGMASDIDWVGKAVADMSRVEKSGQVTAKSIGGNFREAFTDAAGYADGFSGAARSDLIPMVDGVVSGIDEMANGTEMATQGVDSLTAASEETKSTWEEIEGWVNKAVGLLGIDSEVLTNNIWTGLARVGKESLLALGVDVDDLSTKMQDFFAQAKGYGLDINQFWEWAQKGTGQTTKQIWDQTLEQMAKATGTFIMQASAMFASGTIDWKELFGGLWRGVLASSVTALAKMVAEWIAGLEIIAQAKAWLETMPGVGAAIAIGALAVGAVAMLASSAKQPAMAEGGVVTSPTHALIGEAGPEAVFPLEKLNDLGIPYGRGARGEGASASSVVNVTINNPVLNNRTTEKDLREFMDKFARTVSRGGGRVNAYA